MDTSVEKTSEVAGQPHSEAKAQGTAIVVFGMDDSGKPHASRFGDDDAQLAEKAAELMGMHVFRPATDEHRALAAKLPIGRVFGSGKAFVPFVKSGLYAALAGAAGVSATEAAQPRKTPPTAPLGQPEGMPTGSPAATFAEIGVGSLVLARDNPDEAWFKAIVLKLAGDKATLAWSDYPDYPRFSRRLWQLGLMPPERRSA